MAYMVCLYLSIYYIRLKQNKKDDHKMKYAVVYY